jgi:hypothetical protein
MESTSKYLILGVLLLVITSTGCTGGSEPTTTDAPTTSAPVTPPPPPNEPTYIPNQYQLPPDSPMIELFPDVEGFELIGIKPGNRGGVDVVFGSYQDTKGDKAEVTIYKPENPASFYQEFLEEFEDQGEMYSQILESGIKVDYVIQEGVSGTHAVLFWRQDPFIFYVNPYGSLDEPNLALNLANLIIEGNSKR